MRGFHVALIAKEEMHLIPGDPAAQRIADKQSVQGFRRGTSSKRYVKGALHGNRGCRSLNEFLRRALGDGCAVRQDSNLTIHLRSPQVMIPILSGTAILPRFSTSSSPMRRHERASRSSKSPASIGPHEPDA